MRTFGGSVKALDEAAVGRFGLGHKSVFHLCDAFVVAPDGYGALAPFVVNPFEALGRPGDACLDWTSVAAADAARLRVAGATILPGRQRLNLWFPLRRPSLRPKPKSRGIVASDIAPASLAPLAELLAALRHVKRVSVVIGAATVELDRRDAPRMVGHTLRAWLGTPSRVAVPWEAPGEQADVGDQEEGGRGGDGFLPVPGEPAASSEPGEGPLDDPATGQNLEPLCRVGAPDDLEGPLSRVGERGLQLVAGVAAVGEDVAQPGPAGADPRSARPARRRGPECWRRGRRRRRAGRGCRSRCGACGP
jgi:hypothetical protein